MAIEHDCILSKQGDITIAYKCMLPEIFTLSDQEYEGFHQAWIKAIKLLPKHSIFYKQDWFTATTYQPDFIKDDTSFLTRSSERFLMKDHISITAVIFFSKKPHNRKLSSSVLSNLLRKSIVPVETINTQLLQDF